MTGEESATLLVCHFCRQGSKKPIEIENRVEGWAAWSCRGCLRRHRKTTQVWGK